MACGHAPQPAGAAMTAGVLSAAGVASFGHGLLRQACLSEAIGIPLEVLGAL